MKIILGLVVPFVVLMWWGLKTPKQPLRPWQVYASPPPQLRQGPSPTSGAALYDVYGYPSFKGIKQTSVQRVWGLAARPAATLGVEYNPGPGWVLLASGLTEAQARAQYPSIDWPNPPNSYSLDWGAFRAYFGPWL